MLLGRRRMNKRPIALMISSNVLLTVKVPMFRRDINPGKGENRKPSAALKEAELERSATAAEESTRTR